MTAPLDRIKTRIHEIDAELERLDRRGRVLKDELADLTVAMRVLGEYSADEGVDGEIDPTARRRIIAEPAELAEAALERPWKVVPPVTAMIIEALEGLDLIGGSSHSPQDIADFIHETWSVDVDNKRIAQVASRLAKEKRVARVAVGKYVSAARAPTVTVAELFSEDEIG